MHDYLVKMLICPACRGSLSWTISEQRGDRIEAADASCTLCEANYPVRDGIGLFLTPDLPRHDLWEEVESGLPAYLRENPETAQQLLEAPLETLGAADYFFRSMALEERGDFDTAKAVADKAEGGLYTKAYLAASERILEAAIDHLEKGSGPIVDLASGRGHLVERIVRRLKRPVVMTDFSPLILRRNRRWFTHFGLYEQISLLAFDARKTPFADNAVQTLTTYYGLANIERPGELLAELRRIVSGTFLACTLFYPEGDEANRAVIREIGLEEMMYSRLALAQFEAAKWRVSFVEQVDGEALPTPRSELLGGAGIDGLPVAPTTILWRLLAAR